LKVLEVADRAEVGNRGENVSANNQGTVGQTKVNVQEELSCSSECVKAVCVVSRLIFRSSRWRSERMTAA
jgi:hypothetical protein